MKKVEITGESEKKEQKKKLCVNCGRTPKANARRKSVFYGITVIHSSTAGRSERFIHIQSC